MDQYGWGNCPDPVRRQVDRLMDGWRTYLAENLLGVYLHGSLAMGCFKPGRSDLDLLVITHHPLALETKRNLAGLMLEVSGQPSPVEVSCLCQADMLPWRHPTPFDFHYSETWREAYVRDLGGEGWKEWNAVRRCDEDLAAHITITRRRGVCLCGPAIPQVFPEVPCRDYLASVLGDVLSAEFGLRSALENPVYVVLNACRTLAYLRTGQVLSKDEGGVWALQALPGRFQPVLAAALDAYRACVDDGGLSREATADLALYLRGQLEALAPLAAGNCQRIAGAD